MAARITGDWWAASCSTLGGDVCLDLREETLARWLAARIAWVTANWFWCGAADRSRFAANWFGSWAANRSRCWAANRCWFAANWCWFAANRFWAAVVGLHQLAKKVEACIGLRGGGRANNSQHRQGHDRTDHKFLQVRIYSLHHVTRQLGGSLRTGCDASTGRYSQPEIKVAILFGRPDHAVFSDCATFCGSTRRSTSNS